LQIIERHLLFYFINVLFYTYNTEYMYKKRKIRYKWNTI